MRDLRPYRIPGLAWVGAGLTGILLTVAVGQKPDGYGAGKPSLPGRCRSRRGRRLRGPNRYDRARIPGILQPRHCVDPAGVEAGRTLPDRCD